MKVGFLEILKQQHIIIETLVKLGKPKNVRISVAQPTLFYYLGKIMFEIHRYKMMNESRFSSQCGLPFP